MDQFEEVFAPGVADAERDELIERVYALARPGPDGSPGALVVLGLRADFYGRALADPRLARSLQDGQVVVGPMTAQEVRAAIEGPAQAAHLDLEPGLADLMLRDLRPVSARRGAHDPGALPLLSHALLSTWQGRRSGRLTIEGYRASGGITDAVARSADLAYAGLTASQQRAARRLFLRLVWVADDGADTRRRVPLADLATAHTELEGAADDDLSTVLALFVDHRLITSDEHTAEITHEALLTAWPQLRSWIDESRAELVIARRIAESAQLWQDAGRDDADLLRGGRLAMARGWAAEPATSTPAAAAASAERRATLSATELRFVDASFARYRAEQAEQRRVSRRIRRLAATLAVVLLGTAALAGYAWQQRADAGQQRNQADSRQDAAEAMNLRSQDPTLAEQLSLAAYRMAPTSQARGSLLTSSDTPLAARLLGPSDTVQSVALSPDHGVLAVAAADGTVRLWNVARPDHPVSLGGPFVRQKQAFYAAAFSPDGKVLAVAGAGEAVQLWNVARPSRPVQLGHPLTGPAGTVYALAFSPAGTTLAAGSADGTVRLWTMGAGGTAPATGRPVALSVTAGDYVQTVAFNPAGTELAAGTSGGTVARWTLPVAKGPGAKGPGAKAGGAAHPEWPGRRGVLGRVQPGRPNAGRGQQGQDRVAVGRDQPGPAAPHGPVQGGHQLDQRGGVQPGRVAAGRREQRRLGPAVGRGHRGTGGHAAGPGPGHHPGLGQRPAPDHRGGRRQRPGVGPAARRAGRRRPGERGRVQRRAPGHARGGQRQPAAVGRRPPRSAGPGGDRAQHQSRRRRVQPVRFGAGGRLPGRDAADVPGDHGRWPVPPGQRRHGPGVGHRLRGERGLLAQRAPGGHGRRRLHGPAVGRLRPGPPPEGGHLARRSVPTCSRSRSTGPGRCWPRAARTRRSGCGTSPTRLTPASSARR